MKTKLFCLLVAFLGLAKCKSAVSEKVKGFSNIYDTALVHSMTTYHKFNDSHLRPMVRRKRYNSKEKVAFQYPVYQNNHEPVKKKVEFVPGIGEVVIQDRFEPRPLFAYRKQQAAMNGDSSKPSPTPAPSPSPTKVPVTTVSRSPPQNLYQSPYSSYNPPDFVPDDSPNYFYPPNVESSTGMATLGPPLAPDTQDNDSLKEMPQYPDENNSPKAAGDNNNGFYPPHEKPEENEPDVYYPPENVDSMTKDNDYPDHNGVNFGAPFPQYLYDHHDHHHVYEEVPHTTAAPAKEDKRVSSTHYSYYYLGRKLWYVPLYFSIYFIIYVTILIVKSIARHKVQLKYQWIENESSRQSRSFNMEGRNELNRVHRNVSFAIDNATEKYLNGINM